MIIPKRSGVWQSFHVHRAPRRRNAKLEGWPDPRIHCVATDGGAWNNSASEYPDSTFRLFKYAMARCPSISMDAKIMQGQPCILGTRIPVRSVLRVLEQYGSIAEVKQCYPHLTVDQIEDALYFSQIILELPSGRNETAIIAR